MFQGQHTHVIVDKHGNCSACRLEPSSIASLAGHDLTELDRLSYTVRTIDNQCTVVPVGSYKKTPLSEVVRNEAFEGCMMEKIDDLNSYMYFRTATQKDKHSMCERKADIFKADFLDNVAVGQPHGGWTIMRDTSQRFAVLRSRVWPGFLSFHKANT